MDPATLYQQARRYLTARHAWLKEQYGLLPRDGRRADGYHYTTEAKRIFPRFHVADAILVEVERLDPDRLPRADAVVRALLAAADGAESVFTEPPHGAIEVDAMARERELFTANVRRWAAQPDLRADPLPCRRVLAPGEAAAWRTALQQRCGVRDGYWHPLLDSPVPPDVLVLTDEAMWDDDGVAQVRRVLDGLGRARIAYASHEGTVAFGGVLAAELLAPWPAVDDWRWPGWPPRRRG